MSSLDYLKKVNVPKLVLVVFMLCTIGSGLYSANPLYEVPDITVITGEIPEYELLLKNDTWTPPERILLANLTPRLEDPSWHSTESAQREYHARIVDDDDSSTLYFNNRTAENENYTGSAYAGWDLLWPFAVFNYTELTAEWHIRVLHGNITVDSFFTIGRGYSWVDMRGRYVPNSYSEMNASAGDEITLVSSASNFTESFTYVEVGILSVQLDIYAAQGSIVAVDNVEVWISTDEPLCQVTLDFQSLYGESLFSDPSIVSQWLGTAYTYPYEISKELTIYLRSLHLSTIHGSDLMPVTRSNQTTYLPAGNYSLTLGWSGRYSWNDEYIFNMTLESNSSVLMSIPLPFNPLSIEPSIIQLPGSVRVNYQNHMNISETEDYSLILPGCSSFSLQVSLPGIYWQYTEIELIEGASSTIIIDLKLIPVLGICFTQQQVTGIVVTFIFAILSLLVLLYRWYVSKDTSYTILVPLLLFAIGLVLPWYVRTEVVNGIEYSTYISPILGNRLWHLDNLFLIGQSIASSDYFAMLLLPSLAVTYTLGFTLAFVMYYTKAIDSLFAISICILIGGVISFFSIGGLPWLGFWCMLTVPLLSYCIKSWSEKDIDKTTTVDRSKLQMD